MGLPSTNLSTEVIMNIEQLHELGTSILPQSHWCRTWRVLYVAAEKGGAVDKYWLSYLLNTIGVQPNVLDRCRLHLAIKTMSESTYD